MDCAQCGLPLHKSATTCPVCGAAVVRPPRSPSGPLGAPPKKGSGPLPPAPARPGSGKLPAPPAGARPPGKPGAKPAAGAKPHSAGIDQDLILAALASSEEAERKQAAAPVRPGRPRTGPPAESGEAPPRPPADPAKEFRGNLLKLGAALLVVVGLVFSPPVQGIYRGWVIRQAVDDLPVMGVSFGAQPGGPAELQLPQGSRRVQDPEGDGTAYEVSRQLDLGGKAPLQIRFAVAKHALGMNDGYERGRKRIRTLQVEQETHRRRRFNAVRFTLASVDGLPAVTRCYFEPVGEGGVCLSVSYDAIANDPRALAAALDRMLGSLPE